jgi:hypothetical protein
MSRHRNPGDRYQDTVGEGQATRPLRQTPSDVAALVRLSALLQAGASPADALLAMARQRGIAGHGESPKEGNTPMSMSNSEDHWKSAGSSPP